MPPSSSLRSRPLSFTDQFLLWLAVELRPLGFQLMAPSGTLLLVPLMGPPGVALVLGTVPPVSLSILFFEPFLKLLIYLAYAMSVEEAQELAVSGKCSCKPGQTWDCPLCDAVQFISKTSWYRTVESIPLSDKVNAFLAREASKSLFNLF